MVRDVAVRPGLQLPQNPAVSGMDLKLAKVILWPKNPKNAIREVPFASVGVSVVSGWSQKGKSALIHIIDYCLGSEKCAIPVGEVREKVAWFGLLCHLPRKRQLLLARKNPGDHVQSSEMVLIEGANVAVPVDIETAEKVGHAAVIKRMDGLAGLPSHDIATGESGFSGPPSFRDMAAFEFQPQHIIANPHTLFFKADTFEHREKLIRSVLPYVLGAVDAETLEAQAQLRLAETEFNGKNLELQQAKKAADVWLPRLQSFYAIARDQGLLPSAPEPRAEWTPQTYRDLLRSATEEARTDTAMHLPVDATRQVVTEISSLRQESARLSRTISDRRRRFEKIQAVRAAAGGYVASLQEQSTRLAPVGWFAQHVRDTSNCPLCGLSSNATRKVVNRLAEAGDEIASRLATIPSTSESLEGEAVRLEGDIAEAKATRDRIDARLRQWSDYSEQLKHLTNRRDFIQRFVGQLMAALESVDSASDVGTLTTEVAALKRKVERLEKKANEPAIRGRMRTAIESVSKRIGFYAKILDVEHSSRTWELDAKSLMLRTADKAERADHLWEIGSAANWMGYHIATLLALHEHFRSVEQNPVPKFLVLDQPSQAFFPEGIDAARRKSNANSRKLSDDLARLRRLFSALSKAIDRTQRGLQIIVLEHADQSVWKSIAHIEQVAEWRGNDALIPLNWK